MEAVTNDTCPIRFALDIFGDKWSLLIVRDMIFMNKRHYGEFLNSAEKISTNILANRLVRLESEGIITKARDPENSARNIYRLTEEGIALVPLLLEMVIWSARHEPQLVTSGNSVAGAPEGFLHHIQEDRDAVIEEIVQRLRA